LRASQRSAACWKVSWLVERISPRSTFARAAVRGRSASCRDGPIAFLTWRPLTRYLIEKVVVPSRFVSYEQQPARIISAFGTRKDPSSWNE
jgi:hypothetical protein